MAIKHQQAVALDGVDFKVQHTGTNAIGRKDAGLLAYKHSTDKTAWHWQNPAAEEFRFTIDTRQTNTATTTADTTFSIPVSNVFSYNWRVDWGDGSAEQTYASIGANTDAGITHDYAATGAGRYQITIKPAGGLNEWFRAFGFAGNTSGANAQENKNKVASLDSLLTVAMFANAGATTVGNNVCQLLFYGCRGSGFTLSQKFGFAPEWNNVTTVGNYFCDSMFYNCTSIELLPSRFNLPTGITTTGSYFCNAMFRACGSLTYLPNNFNLPPGITSIGQNFGSLLFYQCSSLKALPNNFNLPPGIVGSAGSTSFAGSMFGECRSLTALPNNFNLPVGITSTGNYFCSQMFHQCISLTSLPSNFNVPAGITTVGPYFCIQLFNNCTSLTALPSNFNLPTGITTVGIGFCESMFQNCTNDIPYTANNLTFFRF